MQPSEDRPTPPEEVKSKRVRTDSVFGQYLSVMCDYLQISQMRLAQVAGLRESTITNFISNPKRRPEEDTLKRLAGAIEYIAEGKRSALGLPREKRGGPFYLPPKWQAEFFLSTQLECTDHLTFYAYFKGEVVRDEALREMDAFFQSYLWTLEMVRRRSRSDK